MQSQGNPHGLRNAASSLREIRMVAWNDPRKDLPKPLPHMILDAPTDELPAFKDLGYTEMEVRHSTSVYFLAVNHRKASLASVDVKITPELRAEIAALSRTPAPAPDRSEEQKVVRA